MYKGNFGVVPAVGDCEVWVFGLHQSKLLKVFDLTVFDRVADGDVDTANKTFIDVRRKGVKYPRTDGIGRQDEFINAAMLFDHERDEGKGVKAV